MFADVTNDVTFARQEIFGLVLVASPSTTMPTPIAMANDSNFGLGSAIWTRDVARAHRVAGQLETGMVWINDHRRLDAS